MLLKGKAFQEFRFPFPVAAKYAKVRIADAHTAEYCYLRELQIYGTFTAPVPEAEAAGVQEPASEAAL